MGALYLFARKMMNPEAADTKLNSDSQDEFRARSSASSVLCVITRFRLRRPWHALALLALYLGMRKDIGHASGLVRHSLLLAGPLTFFALSIWESEDDLMKFAGSGGHARALRTIRPMCSELWSSYWRLDAVSGSASIWGGLLLRPTRTRSFLGVPPSGGGAQGEIGKGPS